MPEIIAKNFLIWQLPKNIYQFLKYSAIVEIIFYSENTKLNSKVIKIYRIYFCDMCYLLQNYSIWPQSTVETVKI